MSKAAGTSTALSATAQPRVSHLRVLLTNDRLTERGGAGLYLRDVALGLLRKGHRPVVYSPELGEVAAELRAATIPVVSDLNDLAEEPDVIHGQNHLATMTALLHFSRVPAVFICHSWNDPQVHFPRILRYVAVDEVCYDHLVSEGGIAPEKVKLLLNFADLQRFRPRAPLPETPRRALIFSNGVAEGQGLEPIQEACTRAGLDLDAIGYATGSATARPEEVLPEYDIVFAKARCAIEALVVGCAVVVCDVAGLADLATTENLEDLRRLNFGRRSLSRPLGPDILFDAIRAYSAQDAGRVSKRMRDSAGLGRALYELIGLYETVVREHRKSRPDPEAEMRAAAAYLAEWANELANNRPSAVAAVAQPARAVTNLMADQLALTLVAELPLHTLQPTAGRILEPEDAALEDPDSLASGVTVRTPGLAWQYAVIMPLPDGLPEELCSRSGVLRVRLRVRKGPIGVGLLNEQRTGFLTRQGLDETSQYVDLFLRIPRISAATDLVLQTWDKPVEGLIDVGLVELYAAGTMA